MNCVLDHRTGGQAGADHLDILIPNYIGAYGHLADGITVGVMPGVGPALLRINRLQVEGGGLGRVVPQCVTHNHRGAVHLVVERSAPGAQPGGRGAAWYNDRRPSLNEDYRARYGLHAGQSLGAVQAQPAQQSQPRQPPEHRARDRAAEQGGGTGSTQSHLDLASVAEVLAVEI